MRNLIRRLRDDGRIIPFLLLVLANLMVNMVYSIQGPLLPEESATKHVSSTDYGMILGIYELTHAIFNPVAGFLSMKVDVINLFGFGMMLVGFSTFIFGYLTYINIARLFVFIGCVLRIIEATGASLAYVCIYCITIMLFPGDIMPTAIGTMEGMVGISFSIGPFIGTALRQLGGFILPFEVLGGAIFLLGILLFIILRRNKAMALAHKDNKLNQMSEDVSFKDLLRNPKIAFYMTIVLVSGINNTFLIALLEVHLSQFNLIPIYVGLVFLCNGVSCAITAPLTGYLTGILRVPELVQFFGLFCYMTFALFAGPVPFIPLEPSLLGTTICAAIFGIGTAAELGPGFLCPLKEAEQSLKGKEVTGKLSGLWLTFISIGALIGPLLGGILNDNFGFSKACYALIGIDSVAAFAIPVFVMMKLNALDSGISNIRTALGLAPGRKLLKSGQPFLV